MCVCVCLDWVHMCDWYVISHTYTEYGYLYMDWSCMWQSVWPLWTGVMCHIDYITRLDWITREFVHTFLYTRMRVFASVSIFLANSKLHTHSNTFCVLFLLDHENPEGRLSTLLHLHQHPYRFLAPNYSFLDRCIPRQTATSTPSSAFWLIWRQIEECVCVHVY